jgi:hypothetical protein
VKRGRTFWLIVGASLTIGAGALALLFCKPAVMASATTARDLISFDCVLVKHVVARVVNDQREPFVSPLAGVSFELDDLTHGRLNVADKVVSAADGTAVVRKDYPGCPDIELRIRALAPQGFTPPAQQANVHDGEESIPFTFVRVK